MQPDNERARRVRRRDKIREAERNADEILRLVQIGRAHDAVELFSRLTAVARGSFMRMHELIINPDRIPDTHETIFERTENQIGERPGNFLNAVDEAILNENDNAILNGSVKKKHIVADLLRFSEPEPYTEAWTNAWYENERNVYQTHFDTIMDQEEEWEHFLDLPVNMDENSD